MNKFIVSILPTKKPINEDLPVLYKVNIGNGKYYLHKSKKLIEGAERLMDDVYRGMRSKGCPEAYSEVVKYCNQYPAIHKVSVELVLNAEPGKVLKMETKLYKSMLRDSNSLNRIDLEPYKPEWMIKQALQSRCEQCLPDGIVNGKKLKFRFCPNCGRLNK